jgi:hypothetical protein
MIICHNVAFFIPNYTRTISFGNLTVWIQKCDYVVWFLPYIILVHNRDNIMLINKIDNHILVLFECEVTSTTPVTLSWGRNVTSKMLTTEFVFFSKSWTIRSCQLQSIEITYQIKIQIMNWKTYFLNGELNLIINRKIHYQWKYDIFK